MPEDELKKAQAASDDAVKQGLKEAAEEAAEQSEEVESEEETQTTDAATEEGAEVSGEEVDPEDEAAEAVLSKFAVDNKVDPKKLAKRILELEKVTSSKAESGERLTAQERLAIQDAQTMYALISKDPTRKKVLESWYQKEQGIVTEPEMAYDEAKRRARALREEGKHEEAHELLVQNDPRLKRAERIAEEFEAEKQRRANDNFERAMSALTEKFGKPDEAVTAEMTRLYTAGFRGSLEKVYSVACYELGRGKPVPKTPGTNGKTTTVVAGRSTRATGRAAGRAPGGSEGGLDKGLASALDRIAARADGLSGGWKEPEE